MGLYNIDPNLCQNEAQVVKIIGALRSAAMYCNDNGAIIRIIQSLIPKLENKTLEIQWAFVSKSKEPSTNKKFQRFTPASNDGAVLRNAPIDNHGEKSQMQYKTISMIVRKKDPNKDDGGVTLLEIPLLTLSSPQTILCKIGEQNPKNPVYKAFRDACNSYKNDQQQFHAMNAVIKYINENEQDLGNGYKKLRALCKLWLFTNNGVKFIGDPSFNLVKSARNLGVKFIGSRIADEDLVDSNFTLKKLDFTGQWKSLRSEVDSRPEVIYSSVMMATNQYYNGVSIAPAGHPFVLRLDAPPALLNVPREGVTDEILMQQYIKQKVSKEPIPKWVKLIPVTPPETSVMNYLELMADGKANPYGNGFTPFRILSALYSSETDEAKALWGNESNFSTNEYTRDKVEEALNALIDVENNNPQEKGETHSQWLSRIVKMQKKLMTANNGWQSMFNSVLIEMSRSSRFGEQSNREVYFDKKIAETIQGICEKAGITGVLRSKKIQPGSDVVAGYANKLEVNSQDQYQTPEGEDWRIFEKYDSPTFDLTPVLLGQNSDLDESLLVQWSNDAIAERKGKRKTLIWRFKYEKQKGQPNNDLSLYLAKEGNTEQIPPAQTWRTKHADLLEKVGLTDDLEFGTDAQSEAEFLQKVVNYWVSKTDQDGRGLGYIGAVFDGKTAFCGNMDDSETSDKKLPEFYKHLKQKEIKKVENEPNMYNIIMVDDNLKNPTTYLVKVEILPDKKQYQIYSPEKVSKKIKTPIITSEIAEEMIQNISKYLGELTNPTEILQERAEKLSNLLNSIKNENYSEYQVAEKIVKTFGEKKFVLSTIARMLGKDPTYLHDLNKLKQSEENTEENKEEQNQCPIRHGYKNFM